MTYINISIPYGRAHLIHEFEFGIRAELRFIFLLTFHILSHNFAICGNKQEKMQKKCNRRIVTGEIFHILTNNIAISGKSIHL